MKKNLIALLLAAAMTLSLAACGNHVSNEETTPPTQGEVTPEEDTIQDELPDEDAQQPADGEIEQPSDGETAQTPSAPSDNSENNTGEFKPEASKPAAKPEENVPSTPAASSVDLNAFYEAMVEEQTATENWPFMGTVEGEMLDAFYPGLSDLSAKQCYAYTAAISAVAAEVVLVEVSSEADVETVKGIFQARIDAQVNGGAWYPETIENWQNNSRIVSSGNYVMLAVFSDVDDLVAGFNALFA